MTYFTSDEIVKGEYLFVSYRHDDKEIVYAIVDKLLEKGVRLWCDRDLMVGDNWNEKVKSLIEHDNCKGALFFNSTSAFLSQPIAKERELIIQKKGREEALGKSILALPINIGKPSTMRLLKSVFEILPDDDGEIDLKLPLSSLNTIIDLFNNETLYCHATEDTLAEAAETLFGVIKRQAPGTVNPIGRESGGSATKTIGTLPTVIFGNYKGEATDALPEYLLDNGGMITHKGERYLVDGGKVFTLLPLTWICLQGEGDETVMIADSLLESRPGGQELIKWLNGPFLSYAFTEAERDCLIGPVTLLNEKTMAKVSDREYLKVTPSPRVADKQWWIDAYGFGVMQKVVREDGTVYQNGFNSRIKRLGVRPMIRVNMAKLKALI